MSTPSNFKLVTQLHSARPLLHSFSIAGDGYLWYVQREAGMFDKNAAVFRLPRDLRESVLPRKKEELLSGCVNLTYYNETVSCT